MTTRKLGLEDIADLRAYEREREQFRRDVIALKKRRRVPVGPFVTLLFENRQTIRFQIQEMARVERLITDEAIETELRVYNPLIPEPGQLSATLFIELTSEADLRLWLPELVGIETHVALRLGSAGDAVEVRCAVDPDHAERLTREDTTASVHYVHWDFAPDQIDRFAAGPVSLVIDHPRYTHETSLAPDTRDELVGDLRG